MMPKGELWRSALLTSALILAGCGIDQSAAQYDRLRYNELQKADCKEMAAVLSKPLLDESPEEYAVVYDRCERLKALSFDEYVAVAERARRTGSWDIIPSAAPES